MHFTGDMLILKAYAPMRSITRITGVLHPIHTLLGYSQWIVTQFVELELVLVHITAQTMGPTQA